MRLARAPATTVRIAVRPIPRELAALPEVRWSLRAIRVALVGRSAALAHGRDYAEKLAAGQGGITHPSLAGGNIGQHAAFPRDTRKPCPASCCVRA